MMNSFEFSREIRQNLATPGSHWTTVAGGLGGFNSFVFLTQKMKLLLDEHCLAALVFPANP